MRINIIFEMVTVSFDNVRLSSIEQQNSIMKKKKLLILILILIERERE